jgi:hypothetical protein
MKYLVTLELSLENDAEKPDEGILIAKIDSSRLLRPNKFKIRNIRVDYEMPEIRRIHDEFEQLVEALKNCE